MTTDVSTAPPASGPVPKTADVPTPRQGVARRASSFLTTHPRARLALLLTAPLF